MNKLINKILKEATKDDDPFFQPKDISKRKEEKKKRQEELLSKIKLGLQNIKVAYENKNSSSESEKLFLKIFSKFHVNEKYDKTWDGYFLGNKDIKKICLFDLQYHRFWILYDHVWMIFRRRLNWNDDEIEGFMKNMLKEYFKLYEISPKSWMFPAFNTY